MRHALAMTALLAGFVVVWGCGSKEDAKPATTAAPPATTAAPKPAATAKATAEPVKAPPLPAGRSTPPTLEEWNKMTKEVTVKGSSALKCETKIVREYLRVACKGDVEPEGSPKGIKILKGGHGEALVNAGPGYMSLILPYVDGTDFEAAFSWSKKSHKLAVKWPKGAKPAPVVVGVFEGAASPLDGNAKGDFDKLCACHKKVTHSPDCDNIYGAPDADCDRTYANDCEGLPRCLPGFINAAGLGRCYKLCGPGKEACPGGHACSDTFGPSVCMED
jgi:hypothetical protein